MNEVKTKDGSITYYNSEFDEHYHSLSGAEEEAVKKYAEPVRLDILAKRGEVKIFDICFGLGYNSAAAIDMVWKSFPKAKIKITALENDREILKKIRDLTPNFICYPLIQRFVEDGRLDEDNVEGELIIGDAMETVKSLKAKFDVVFLDPFSPKKCPRLWSLDFFKDIYNLMEENSVLATYSCARAVRDNLRNAGFNVQDGPKVGRRSPSTLAYKTKYI